MKGLKSRIFFVGSVILFAIYLLIPSVLKFQMGQTVSRVKKSSDPWYYSFLPAEVLRLGLDLKGGVHLVLGIDFDEVEKDALQKLRSQLHEIATDTKNDIKDVTVGTASEGTVKVTYKDDINWSKFEKLMAQYFGQTVDIASQTSSEAIVKMSRFHEKEVRSRAIEQSLETLRNRIDEFGIAEPILQRHGNDKILVQFPGMKEIGRLKEIISRTAKLSFQIVVAGPEESRGPVSVSQMNQWVEEFKSQKKITLTPEVPLTRHIDDINTFLKDRLPENTEILFQKNTDVNTREVSYTPYLLTKDHMVDGDQLEDAFYGFNPETQEPMVNFSLTPLGATRFEKGTGENVGKFMAIVLDKNVHSAPRINSRISRRGVIEMGNQNRNPSEVLNDAKDTSLVLRSGALPARLEFLEERVIGPSLGADAIRAGSLSLIAGLIVVLIFMVIYYKLSGLAAVMALVLNGLFVFACLAAFEGTLTLPGLAGLTLTLGMAVDANVLIFEYIREELRLGHNISQSIANGYDRAFSAILDSNITTILAAVVLLSFGYGPIRGFAVTLLIGIVSSMFTAIFVTRIAFDYFVIAKRKQSLSI